MNGEYVSILNIASSEFPSATDSVGKVCKLMEFDNYNGYKNVYSNYVIRIFSFFSSNYCNTEIVVRICSRDTTACKLFKLSNTEFFDLFLAVEGTKIVLYGRLNSQYAQIYAQIVYGEIQYVQTFQDNPFSLTYDNILNKIEPINYQEHRKSMSLNNLSLYNDSSINNATFVRTIGGVNKYYDIYSGSDDTFNIAYRGLSSESIGNTDHTKLSFGTSDLKVLCPAGGMFAPSRDSSTKLGSPSNKWLNMYSQILTLTPRTALPTPLEDGMVINYRPLNKFIHYNATDSKWYDMTGVEVTI